MGLHYMLFPFIIQFSLYINGHVHLFKIYKMKTKSKQHKGGFKEKFTQFSKMFTKAAGSPFATIGAMFVILGWLITGPLFGFSDTWQLVINTGTTIITFLMVFLIQNTQNRDSEALQIKLDELIRAVETARNETMDLEELEEEELDRLRKDYLKL